MKGAIAELCVKMAKRLKRIKRMMNGANQYFFPSLIYSNNSLNKLDFGMNGLSD